MTTKPMLQHYFTYRTPKSAYGNYTESFSYREHRNFWCSNHPLEAVYNELYNLVPMMNEAEDPCGETLRLVTNMYYDLYNNGGGNGGRWSITPQFKRAIRQTGMSREAILTLEQRLSNVFNYVCRGRNFGTPKSGCTYSLMNEMGCLVTDVVYFCGLEHCPEILVKIKAENADPYDKPVKEKA